MFDIKRTVKKIQERVDRKYSASLKEKKEQLYELLPAYAKLKRDYARLWELYQPLAAEQYRKEEAQRKQREEDENLAIILGSASLPSSDNPYNNSNYTRKGKTGYPTVDNDSMDDYDFYYGRGRFGNVFSAGLMEHVNKVIDDPEEKKKYEESLSEYDKKRIAEAGDLKRIAAGNNALQAMAISNFNRVEAEAEGRAVRTNTGFVEPTNTFEIPLQEETNDPWKSTQIGIRNVSGAKKAVVKQYPHKRLRIELHDRDGEVQNPTIEDTIEKPARPQPADKLMEDVNAEKEGRALLLFQSHRDENENAFVRFWREEWDKFLRFIRVR